MMPPLPKPLHEVWCSVDSCNEFYGWEDVADLDSRTLKRVPEDGHRYSYTADQMREYGQQVREAALAEAAFICDGVKLFTTEKLPVSYTKGFNEGCEECQLAIRRLK